MVIEKGIVTNYTLGIGEYVVTDGLTEKVTNTKKYENGTAVYYNPVTGEKCESSDAISTTGTKIGCMKWYIFNDAEGLSMVNIILDHNTTPKIVWNSDNKNVSYEESKLKSETDKLVSESK